MSTHKREYDFSKGERGKFYRADVNLNLPIYLEPKNFSFIESIAKRRHLGVSSVVNNLIKSDMQLAEVIK